MNFWKSKTDPLSFVWWTWDTAMWILCAMLTLHFRFQNWATETKIFIFRKYSTRDHVKTFNCDCVVKHWTTKINQRNLVFLFQDAAAAANRDFKLISTFWRENVGSIMEMKLQTVLLLQCAFLPFLTLGLHVTNTNKTVKKEHLGKVRMKRRWNYKYLLEKVERNEII